ncbi:hypothetical protein BTO30_01210 [Domibacillus antri]|uniref:HTH cro/C1-type domain-containing protein n=1 Tax=Domibacillus antri TaxID=1714264 RepID=A0A1Q8Q9Q2_9BACI|nr:helix-turn-helix domain-containing protein [Domibacillus antri]OLN24067.1 hypothetical protein BTO30_01210 [Domibacillus antri]
MQLNELLRYYRKNVLNISQQEMAKRLNISQSSISKYERDGTGIESSMLVRMMNAYQIPKPLFMQALFENSIDYETLSVREHKKSIFEEDFLFFEKLFNDYPNLKKELYHLAYMNKKDRDKHAKAITAMIKAHLSVT